MQTLPEPPPLSYYDPYASRRRKGWLIKSAVAALLVTLVAMRFMSERVRLTLPESGREPSDVAAGVAPGAIGVAEREVTAPARIAPVRHARPAALGTAAAPPSEFDQSEDVTYVPDHAVSMFPTTVETEIRLSTPSDGGAADAEGAKPKAADDVQAESVRAEDDAARDWPILCGQVVDPSGAPVEGAQVELESPGGTVTTDASGRFCVACPEGQRTVRVEAADRGRAVRTVALKSSLFGMRIALLQKP